MSKVLLDLKDCKIMDSGAVLVKYEALFELFREARVMKGITVLEHDDIHQYNQRHPNEAFPIGYIDDVEEMPPVHSFDFNIPSYYAELDVDEYLALRLTTLYPDLPDRYVDRLALELDMMKQREMDGFLRTLIYISETFENNGVVCGIGRGSACASLVLFLIGIHMVDPIEYDIPIEEFLR